MFDMHGCNGHHNVYVTKHNDVIKHHSNVITVQQMSAIKVTA